MRCIDGDALFKDICDSINEMTKIGIRVDGDWLWAKLNDALENAPTIEPPPHYDEWCGSCKEYDQERHSCPRWNKVIRETLKDVGQERKDIIQNFHDYQIDWLKSHYDIELEPQLEEMIVRFLHDTANCYMMNGGKQE